MADPLAALGVEIPVVQAGMGGGLAAHELAAAVSEAGALGTIGILDPGALRGEIAAGRQLTGKPPRTFAEFARDHAAMFRG